MRGVQGQEGTCKLKHQSATKRVSCPEAPHRVQLSMPALNAHQKWKRAMALGNMNVTAVPQKVKSCTRADEKQRHRRRLTAMSCFSTRGNSNPNAC